MASESDSDDHKYPGLSVSEDRVCICGWLTDTLTIERQNSSDEKTTCASSGNIENIGTEAHTLIFFIPGNPGIIHWYTDLLAQIINGLGRGFAAHGISYAGHGVGEDVIGNNADHSQSFYRECLAKEMNESVEGGEQQDMRIPWTMDGQIKHKIEWIDKVLEDRRQTSSLTPSIVFISHSIGAHFVQSLLLNRPDILAKTLHVIHLMPFFRFDPPPMKKKFLSSAANSYKYTIPMMMNLVGALSSTLPRDWIASYLEKVLGVKCAKGRAIALDIFFAPNMVKNHLVLGFEEIRDLPELPNDVALRLITSPTSILFCGVDGDDHWAPQFHVKDLKHLQENTDIPHNLHLESIDQLRHDFVVRPAQVEPVVQFCINRIKNGGRLQSQVLKSKL